MGFRLTSQMAFFSLGPSATGWGCSGWGCSSRNSRYQIHMSDGNISTFLCTFHKLKINSLELRILKRVKKKYLNRVSLVFNPQTLPPFSIDGDNIMFSFVLFFNSNKFFFLHFYFGTSH